MRNTIYLIATLLLSSCATLITKRTYEISVSSNLPNANAVILDSVYSLPATFKIKRSKKVLKIRLFSDTLVKDFLVKAYPSPTFLYGNLLFSTLAPLAYAIDFTNQKRFNYGKSIFLNSSDTTCIIGPTVGKGSYSYWNRIDPQKKEQIYVTVSNPLINTFYIHPLQETSKTSVGFLGISTGVEYFYRDTKYVALTGNAVFNLFFPPTTPTSFGSTHSMNSMYISLTDNYKHGRFNTGYGINFSKNTWVSARRVDYASRTRIERIAKPDNSIGIILTEYFQVNRHFYIGLIYRPTIFKVYPIGAFSYEHLISLDVKWEVRIRK